MTKLIEIIPEIRDSILEMGAEDIWKCYQCGKCSGVCPLSFVSEADFLAHRFPHEVKLGITSSSENKEEIALEMKRTFMCVGCESCIAECPKGVGLMDIIRAIRRIFVDFGTLPQELKSVISKISGTGNPLGEAREKHMDWAAGIDIPVFDPGIEYLYFSCCMPAYDPRLQEVACATSGLMKKAGVSFGISALEEVCCGEAIRRVGSEKLFNKLSEKNKSSFKELQVRKIITTSPHCYTVFKKDYFPGEDCEVVHTVELYAGLIRKAILKPKKEINKRVVYHDPCTLGRQHGVFEEPRDVLRAIPGIELVEVKDFSKEWSLCCGGGSGGVWLDLPPEQRLANIRLQQLADTGADIIAVACPYCLQMFEDSSKVMGIDIDIKDISELLYMSVIAE